MNFLQETRLFSILSIILLATILLGTFIFLNLIFSNFEDYYQNLIIEKHKYLIQNIKDEKIERFELLGGEPFLLGMGLLDSENEIFYPDYVRLYWNSAKKYSKDLTLFQSIGPLKSQDLYFQTVLSPYRDKTFISIYDATSIGFLEEKIKILSIFVISISLILPLYLYLFLRRAKNLYNKLLEEVKENPLVEIQTEDPSSIIEVLKKSNEELKVLLSKEKEKLSELEILSSTLSENLPTGLIILDPDLNIIGANQNLLKILEKEKFKEKEKLEDFLSNWEELLINIKEKSFLKKPIEIRDLKAKDKYFNITLAPLFSNSNFLGTLILLEDITEIKNLQNTLMEKENLASIGSFAAGIAHEFRNSLSTIMGYAKLLQKDIFKEEDLKYWEGLMNEAKHMNLVITSFLEFTKIQKIEREKVELLEILKKVLESLKINYPEIDFILKGENIEIYVDSFLFQQALRAILENSCQAQKEGKIIIEWIEKEDKINLKIQDFGEGMDEETLKRVFIPFFSTKPQGTGLGLSLVHKIVNLHQGKISIFSQKGYGTRVEIIFPKNVLQNDTPKLDLL